MLEQTGIVTTTELGEQEAFAVEESLAIGAGAALPSRSAGLGPCTVQV